MNVPTIKANYEDTQISEEDHKYFASLSSKLEKGAIKVLALSEPLSLIHI